MTDHKTSSSQDLTNAEFVEIYAGYNLPEIELLVDVIKDSDIPCIVRTLEPSQFPISVGKHGQIRIAVDEPHVPEATELIRQAIEDEAVAGDGDFLV